MGMRVLPLLIAMAMAGQAVPAIAAAAPSAPLSPGTKAALPAPNFAHLDWLRRDVKRADGTSLAIWQIYATPVKKGDREGPYRFVEAPGEGVGCVDDVARAAIVYCRHFARTGDRHAAAQARDAFAFLAAVSHPDGTYTNFIDARGRLNLTGPTSRAGLNWWTARAFWALAEGTAAFEPSEPAYAESLRRRAMTTVGALEADLAMKDSGTVRYDHDTVPRCFVAGAPDVTAIMVISLARLERSRHDARLVRLIDRYGRAIAAWAPGEPGTPLWGAHLNSVDPNSWHSYGAHMLEALADGARATGSKVLLQAAEEEADRFVPRLLIAGGPVAGFSPGLVRYPQIAYGLEPEVSGLLALSEVSHEPRYAKLAGLFASWLTGDNPTGKSMYDPSTGRVWDGIDPKGRSEDSGAESTIEGLWVLEALARHPELAPYAFARERASQVHKVAPAGTPVAPDLEYRLFDTPSGAVAVAFNHTSASRTLILPGFTCPLAVPPHAACFAEAPLRADIHQETR